MITKEQYFSDGHGGQKQHQPEHDDYAASLLSKVNAFLDHMEWARPIDPDTGSEISGSKGGSGDGGFRTGDSKTGAPKSCHRTAHAVDVYDPKNELDDAITDEDLEAFGLYREIGTATHGWCHLQDLPPHSGRRTYPV